MNQEFHMSAFTRFMLPLRNTAQPLRPLRLNWFAPKEVSHLLEA